jgi:hypothetical protein
VSEVTDLIDAYRRGELTLEELARRFRERAWPERRPPARTREEIYQRELEDPEPIQHGSFDEVVSAFHRGDITGDEYDVLARAVAEANPPRRPG